MLHCALSNITKAIDKQEDDEFWYGKDEDSY
jgi:hypothetical protein